ncbi:IS4 family transposase [Kutzneria sp. 744]|uniref:IS4 family transposase n=1 Tax=Kutzneria sp. (strain 744) TaxID=345341 RepID=UPI0003EEDA8C|nr:IS4 family transposase [Kutzneria sp. 744]EWM14298.1 transposase [Kutzneria sp. 744]EWM14308.1 transposase [Kutzneria sp. 744]EWM15317.1 transposase [Kutzneria sp. 744]
MDTQSSITRAITVAGGRYAPGHLGELTQHLPFEMIDEALTATRTTQHRLRDLPSRVVVYLLLAACLFPEVGYSGVWRKLTAALDGLPTATPTASGLATARQRVGAAPLRWLFDLLRGPATTGRAPGTRWRGLLVCAIDGTTLTVPDNPRMLTRFTKQRGNHGGAGYPQIRLVALLACGTRSVIDAVFGPTTIGETTYTPQLLRSLHAGMILLGDRNFGAAGLLAQIATTGADLLVRLKNGRTMPILTRYRDGSYLSILGGLRVRVIECEITIATTAGRHTGIYRLTTTLLDPHDYPAAELIRLYHQRWEIETAYLELKSTILGGRVLRARTPVGIEQEIYALLVTYHLLRTAMADATSTRPDTDPDRASFTIAYQTSRDQVIQAANVIAGTVIDLVGTIGRHVLAHLMPVRRLRVCPRIVKRAISKHQARGPNIDRTSYKATLSIDILTPADA